MARIGADTEQLNALSGSFNRARVQLELSRAGIDAQLRRTHWSGRDAEWFRQLWFGRYRVTIGAALELCERAARTLDQQVAQQRNASEAAGTTARGAVVPAPYGTVGPAAAPAGALGSGGQQRFPEEITSLGLGLETTVASWLGASHHRVTLESFADGRVRVTVSDSDDVGAKGSVGGRVTAPFIGDIDHSASGKVLFGQVNRRVFDTDHEGARALIVAAELERSAGRLRQAVELASPASALAAGVLAPLGRHLGVHVDLLPEPVRNESLVELRAAGAFGAVIPSGPQAQGSLNGILRVGTATTTAGQSQLLEAEGNVALSLSGALLGHSGGSLVPTVGDKARPTARRLRVELLDHPGRERAVVTSEVVIGTTVHRAVSDVDLGGPAGAKATEALKRTMAELRAGRLVSPLEALALPPEAVTTESVTFEVSEKERSAGLSGGAGVTVGGEAQLISTHLSRRP